MSGKPAARLGDATTTGGPIVQGSLGVLIGSPNGKACSVCPGGVTVGNPVNPMLGAKVLSGEVDIALPDTLPFVLSRSYSSYQTDTPAPIGLFGPGWQAAFDNSLLITTDELILNDNNGRSIHFEPLEIGEVTFSRSENLWLIRGGSDELPEGHALSRLWHNLPSDIKHNSHFYFVTNDALGPLWLLGYSEPYVPLINEPLPQPLSTRRPLQGIIDRFGRQLHFKREKHGIFAGHVTQVIDHGGRHYQLELTRIPLETSSKKTGWGTDSGIRLSAVYLTYDPYYSDLPDKPLVRYDYTPRGELQTVYDKTSLAAREFTYHPTLTGRMISHCFAGRPITTYRYDNRGRVVKQDNPDGLSYIFEYHKHRTEVTDSLGRKDCYHFQGDKGLKRLVKHQRPDGSEINNEYDSNGRLISIVDAIHRKTEFDLNVATGELLSITTPDNKTTRFSYNAQGQLTQTTLPDGSRKQATYDALGRLTAQSDTQGQSIAYFYADDSSDLVMATEDAMGARRTMKYTLLGQISRVIDCSGKVTEYCYNREGKVTQILLEEGLSQSWEYNQQGRVIAERNSTGEIAKYRHNNAGDIIEIVYPNGSSVIFSYDSWGRPLSRKQGGLHQKLSYDMAGRAQTLTNENGAETIFTYDVMNRLCQEVGFDGRTKRYEYNLAGMLTASQDEDLITRLHYDTAGRLIKRDLPADTDSPIDEFWHYNDNGDLTEVIHSNTDCRIHVLYKRDKAGRIISESQQVVDNQNHLCWQHEVKHAYQSQGLQAETIPDGLTPINWLTYGSGHLLGLKFNGKSIIEFERDNLHRQKIMRFGQNVQQTRYNNAGRLEHVDFSGMISAPFSREYHYDLLGRLIELDATDSHYRYHYDGASRLSKVESPEYQAQYHYDPAGNRINPISAVQPSLSTDERRWQTNRLERDNDYTYHYNRYGNLTKKISHDSTRETHNYHYDSQHRLVYYQRQQLDGNSLRLQTEARYFYDAFGRRIQKQVRNGEQNHIVWYGWDADNLVLTERDNRRIHTVYYPGSFVPLLRIESGQKTERIALGEKLEQQIAQPLPEDIKANLNEIEQSLLIKQLTDEQKSWLQQAQLTAEQLSGLMDETTESETPHVHLYHCNHLGTPLALVDETGKVAWQSELDPWGNLLKEQNQDNLYQPIRMPGQHYDEESGLHYNRHRYYDSKTGRYISQDPIGLTGGFNVYLYPLNPVSWFDPLGLQACFKKRPLSGLPWLGLASNNPLDDYFNTEISHEQLFFSNGQNIGFFGDGKLHEDSSDQIPKYIDGTGPCFEDEELMKQAVENTPPLSKYQLFGSNCQTWAQKVRDEYARLEKMRNKQTQ